MARNRGMVAAESAPQEPSPRRVAAARRGGRRSSALPAAAFLFVSFLAYQRWICNSSWPGGSARARRARSCRPSGWRRICIPVVLLWSRLALFRQRRRRNLGCARRRCGVFLMVCSAILLGAARRDRDAAGDAVPAAGSAASSPAVAPGVRPIGSADHRRRAATLLSFVVRDPRLACRWRAGGRAGSPADVSGAERRRRPPSRAPVERAGGARPRQREKRDMRTDGRRRR